MDIADILKRTSRKNREIQTEYLKVHGNCMEFGETVIQLSNISLLSIENIAPTAFPIWGALVALVGLLLLSLKATMAVVLGLILIVGGAASIYLWYNQRKKDEQRKKLVIAPNSGHIFTIVFDDQAFLEKVIGVLKDVIAGHWGDVIVNIKDNTFSGNASAIHDYAEVNVKGGSD